ncbi:recombinase family protein [Bacillus sp. AFS041924]|uniref:recombinase family protein n=1 Tax=Bacillus sp. AFS041924 TaxID=2033503 RepID=UPI000BFC2714|nr:recombinase family protein [Bacillus sp. AFS041924]PGS49380.1 resolvase [Bacillus sp. AFS041924]
MLIGYMRPNHDDPKCEQQLAHLTQINCDEIVMEDHSSAKNRIQLDKIVTNLMHGDTIVVTKLFNLADSTRHLMEILETLNSKGAFLQSIEENINTCIQSKYFFIEIVKHLLSFQSDVISENTKQGLYEAKQKGISSGRPKKPDENVKRAILMYESKKYTLDDIKRETGISKSTLYRYLEN